MRSCTCAEGCKIRTFCACSKAVFHLTLMLNIHCNVKVDLSRVMRKHVFGSNMDSEEPDQPVKLDQVFAHKVNNAAVTSAFGVSLNRAFVNYLYTQYK